MKILPDGLLVTVALGAADVLAAPAGSLLVSEDGNGTIWRVSDRAAP
jgi:glucose/arabinose dehydrogenase